MWCAISLMQGKFLVWFKTALLLWMWSTWLFLWLSMREFRSFRCLSATFWSLYSSVCEGKDLTQRACSSFSHSGVAPLGLYPSFVWYILIGVSEISSCVNPRLYCVLSALWGLIKLHHRCKIITRLICVCILWLGVGSLCVYWYWALLGYLSVRALK